MSQNSSVSNKTAILLVAGLLGLGFFVLFVLVRLAFRGRSQPAAPTPTALSTTPTFAPTIFVPPAVECAPALTLGTTTLQIETIQRAPDGTVSLPAQEGGIAYWVDGTESESVFLLSSTVENRALVSVLEEGSAAAVTWSNCNSVTYTLSAPQPGMFASTDSPGGLGSDISIFLQPGAAGEGLAVRGELIEEQIVSISTPIPGSVEVQAEISLLEIVTSPDGATIQVEVSIFNYGGSAFSLSANDISLAAQDGATLNLILSAPALPWEVPPGGTETVFLTFPRPGSPIATLRIFTAEYEIEGY
jgi:hypothetical protein